MSCFSRSRLWLKKCAKSTPRPGHIRAGAKPPIMCPSITNSVKALCSLVPPDTLASWRHGVVTWGGNANVGKMGHLGQPGRVGFGLDVVKPSRAKPLTSPAPACCNVACFPRGNGHAAGQKTARKAEFGKVAGTVSCITPAGSEKQIQKPRIIDPWSYATRFVLSSRSKVAKDTWDLGPKICPMSTLEVASSHFSP